MAQALTDGNADDAATTPGLIDAVEGDIASFTADAAYDTIAIYDAAEARGANVVVPPTRTAAVAGRKPRSAARDRTIRKAKEIGRRRWKKESGYSRQGTVKNASFRFKSIIGDRLRARHRGAQDEEALLGCNILNRMLQLGWPASVPIGP